MDETMTDDFLQKLAAGPLSDPNKTFLPKGRKKGQRKRTPDELYLFREDRAAKKERLAKDAADHLQMLFAYYATTDVPVERVALHMGVSEVKARLGLIEHGRKDL